MAHVLHSQYHVRSTEYLVHPAGTANSFLVKLAVVSDCLARLDCTRRYQAGHEVATNDDLTVRLIRVAQVIADIPRCDRR